MKPWDGSVIPWWSVALIVALFGVVLLSGCAAFPIDLAEHERRHCAGEDHTGDRPFYTWTKARPASIQPWLYVYVNDIDRVCREAGAQASASERIDACATWKPTGCIIYLPK